MDDGTMMRVGYAGQNGHPYYAVGRELIKMGALTKDTVSMQAIEQWLAENPERADEIMNTNRSYVFFQELESEGPLGGENVPLTAERSLAVDRSLLPYGMPLWVDIEAPMADQLGLRRLMIAQDTGGAIRGAVRGDVFWGYGERAETIAGHMKAKLRYWALLPNVLDTDSEGSP
jgi:membrane-bound lytic murein transglycosylase A